MGSARELLLEVAMSDEANGAGFDGGSYLPPMRSQFEVNLPPAEPYRPLNRCPQSWCRRLKRAV